MSSRLLTLHHPAKSQRYYESGVWCRDTFYSLLCRHAAERPDDHALRDSRERLRWGQLKERVDALAEELRGLGLRSGERVSAWLPNCVDTVIIFLACSRNGYVCNFALHHNYTVREIVHLLDRIQNVVLFTKRSHGADGADVDILGEIERIESMRRVYFVGEGVKTVAWNRPGARQERMPQEPDDDPDKIVCLSFTSGTTGAPKGVLHSENTLLANGRVMVADWQHNKNTILLCLSPLSHAIGFFATSQMLTAGLELVVHDLPAGMGTLDWVLETGATYVMGVPTHAIDIQAEMKTRGMSKLGDVRIFYMGGARIPASVTRTFMDAGIMPINTYGMTESGAHQYTRPQDTAERIVETSGRACSAYEVRIFDQEDRDREVATGVVGEIGGRGGILMLGYFDDQKATEGAFNIGGWFMSGDLGSLDENGYLRMLGRKKDLVIRGGHNIHPAPIEELAMQHSAISRAAGFPVADERLGEKLCFALVLTSGAAISADEFLLHLHRGGLSKYDMPEYFVTVESLPLTASGKVMKRALVEWVTSGRIVPQPIRWTPPKQGQQAEES